MNSFQELNFYSNVGVPFGDSRDYAISFSSNTATNSNVTTSEGLEFYHVPGIDITNVLATPRDIIYTVNVASLSGATVNWPTPLPEGIVANTGGTGIYRAYGVNGTNVWNQIKSPGIVPPRDYFGTWTYSASITYPNTANVTLSNTISWTNTVTVINVAELEFSSSPANVTYNQYATTTVTPYAQIVDAEADGIFTAVVSANATSAINSITSTGIGGTATYNATDRKYVITGYRAQVNSHLRNLVFRPEYTFIENFVMYYTLLSPSGQQTQQVTQNFNIGNIYPVLSTPANVSYSQDTPFTITSYASLADDSAWSPAPTYTITVTPSTTAGINTMTTSGSGGTVNFNGTTKVLTVSGTRVQINSHLSTLTITPTAYYIGNYSLTYLVTSPGGDPVTQYINVNPSSVTLTTPDDLTFNEDETNLSITSVPSIVDTNFGIASVTLPFTMNLIPANTASISSIVSYGNLGAVTTTNATSKVYSIAGNLAQIRSELSNIKLTPTIDFASDFDLYYNLKTASGNVNANVSQSWLIGGTNVETINSDNTRYYVKNNIDLLFPNAVPQVYETISGTPNYTVELTLNSNIGSIISKDEYFAVGNVVASYSNITSNVSANVVTCINFNGTNNSQPANINLVSNVTMTYYGDCNLTTSRSKFGNACLAVPQASSPLASGMQLNPPTSTYFDFGVGDFTIDFWVYFPYSTGVNGNQIFDFRTAAGQDSKTYSDNLSVVGSNIYYNIWLGVLLTGIKPITTATWHHIAITRENKRFRTFVNGELDIDSYQERVLTAGTFTPTPKIGTRYSGGGGGVAGMFIDDLRIIKGSCLYNYPFSVPTTQSSNIVNTVQVVPNYSNVPITSDNWHGGNLTYSISGTKSQVNSKLANLYFVPTKDIYTTSTITYAQSRDSTLQNNNNFSIVGSDSTYVEQLYVYDTPGNYSLELSLEDMIYRKVDLLLIGGGGGGGIGNAGYNIWGGGGGAGGYLEYANINLASLLSDSVSNAESNTFTITVGAGGLNGGGSVNERGTPGGYSTISDLQFSANGTTANAIGGGGGASSQSFDYELHKYCAGGSGGSGGASCPSRQSYQGPPGTGIIGQGNDGGYGNNAFGRGGGGGGGAASAGRGSGDIPSGGVGYYVGGAGKYSTLTGANVYYSVGGEPSWTVHSTGTVPFTNPGCGGTGGLWNPYDFTTISADSGQDGIVVIKLK